MVPLWVVGERSMKKTSFFLQVLFIRELFLGYIIYCVCCTIFCTYPPSPKRYLMRCFRSTNEREPCLQHEHSQTFPSTSRRRLASVVIGGEIRSVFAFAFAFAFVFAFAFGARKEKRNDPSSSLLVPAEGEALELVAIMNCTPSSSKDPVGAIVAKAFPLPGRCRSRCGSCRG